MNIPFWFKYQWRLARIKPTRYKTLIKEIYEHKARNIIEVGVFNGRNSLRMIEAAKVHYDASKIHYYGFDLFEMLTKQDLQEEFSKTPLPERAIYHELDPTGANINLFKGYSQNTLKEFV